MRSRMTLVLLVAVAFALAPAGGSVAEERQPGTICTWGGTPAATTGAFIIKPGITATPSTGPLKFYATGVLGGGQGCTGTFVFDGEINAGSSCGFATFQGKAKGLPGVARFAGTGNVFLPSVLFDRAGNVVGFEQAQVLSGVGDGSEASDCGTPEGFTNGSFSSVIELLPNLGVPKTEP